MRLRVLTTLFLLPVFAFGPVAAANTSEQGAITVEDARASETPGAAKVGAAYLTILNASDKAISLLSATSSAADKVEFHSMTSDDGIMRMRPLTDPIPVPAKGYVKFEPGGMHLMLQGLGKPLVAGDKVPLTLTFENGLTVDVELVVEARRTGGATPHH